MIRSKTTVNVAAIRAFRPRVMSGVGASLSRLSRRFYPSLFDKTMFASVSTMYRRKAQKVLPVNQPRLTGDGPGGEVGKDSSGREGTSAGPTAVEMGRLAHPSLCGDPRRNAADLREG